MVLPLFLEAKLEKEIQNWLKEYNILHPIYTDSIIKLENFLKQESNPNCIGLLNLINDYKRNIINLIAETFRQKNKYFDKIPSTDEKDFWSDENKIEQLLKILIQQDNLKKQIGKLCNRLRELYQALAEYRICQILSNSSFKFSSDREIRGSTRKTDFVIEVDNWKIALEVKAPVCYQEEDICIKKTIEHILKSLQAVAKGSSLISYQCYYDDRNPFFSEKEISKDYYNSNAMIFEVLLRKINRNLKKQQWVSTGADCKLAIIFLDAFTFKYSFDKEILKEFSTRNIYTREFTEINGILYYLIFGRKGDNLREITDNFLEASFEGVKYFSLSQNGLRYSFPDLDGFVFHYLSSSHEDNLDLLKEYFAFFPLNNEKKECLNNFLNRISISLPSINNRIRFILSVTNITEY